LWLNVDLVNHRLRGYAVVRDVADNVELEVALNELYIERRIPGMLGSRVKLTESYWHDHDGWWDTFDDGATGLVDCAFLPYEFRITTQMHWRVGRTNELIGEGQYDSLWVSADQCNRD
jgi:hypothetical protein